MNSEPRSTVDLEDKRPEPVEREVQLWRRNACIIFIVSAVIFLCFLFFGRGVAWKRY